MKRSHLMAALLAGLLASPDPIHQRDAAQLLPRKPRTRRNGMRRATERPWNATEEERRRSQIERGVLRSESRGRPAGGLESGNLNMGGLRCGREVTGIAQAGGTTSLPADSPEGVEHVA